MTTGTPQQIDPQAHFLDGPELPSGTTRFWLVRHGVVEEPARQTMYGTLDVPLCQASLKAHHHAYASLAERLPRQARWLSSPLERAQNTGRAIQQAGKFSVPINIEPGFIEQSMGIWSGTPHDDFPTLLHHPPHPFWSISATEEPPEGESMEAVKKRVGHTLERLAHDYAGNDMVVLSHGGAIRMALAYSLGIPAHTALHFCIQNLSISIIEHIEGTWRVVSVNSLPNFGGRCS